VLLERLLSWSAIRPEMDGSYHPGRPRTRRGRRVGRPGGRRTVCCEDLPVTVDSDGAQIPVVPPRHWHGRRLTHDAVRGPKLSYSPSPATDTRPWTAERLHFPVANVG
jgi:hypothetical protein